MSVTSSGAMPSGSGHGARYFSLRWNSHPVELVSGFTGLYQSETLVDVTLAAEGKHLQAHKMLLSACSDYFQALFSINPCQHPIVILKDVNFDDLQTIVQFMYNGTVNISGEKLPDIMKIAETLQIKGLAGGVISSGMPESRNPKFLSVSQQSRQLSTESLPEYFHRTHTGVSPRNASFESRQYSAESATPIKRQPPSPPVSPPRHFRKKFRRMSGAGSSSERGNSVEDERSPGGQTISHISPQPIHLSPSRQSSSSTELECPTGTIVAKKKRELFSARSSRSGGSNKSSSEYSRDYSFSSKQQESTGSSGQSQSISKSVDDDGGAPPPPPTSSGSTLTVPGASTMIRSLVRSQSSIEHGGSCLDGHQQSKRSRFLLKRQDCLEKGTEGELDLTAPPVSIQPPTPTDIKSEISDSPLNICTSFPSLASPHPSFERDPTPPIPQRAHATPVLTKQRSAPLMSSLDSHDLPPLLPKPPPYSPSHPTSPHAASLYHDYSLGSPLASVQAILHHPMHHQVPPAAHTLPSVRVIRDVSPPPCSLDPLRLDHHESSGLLHPGFRSKSTETPSYPDRYDPRTELPPRRPSGPHSMGPDKPSQRPPSSNSPSTSSSLSIVGSMPVEQFGHCPKAREGPALGCNYCWNTTDPNGRILRRKTKYHCPDCQANLCIVPCFQAYHEALEKDRASVASH